MNSGSTSRAIKEPQFKACNVYREADNFGLHTSDFHSLPKNNAALFIDNVDDKPRLFRRFLLTT